MIVAATILSLIMFFVLKETKMEIAIVQVTALDATILTLGKFPFRNFLSLPFTSTLKSKGGIDRYDRFDRGHAEVASVAAEDYQTIGLGHHAVGSGSSRGLSALSVRGRW